jgi:hypothetical protein
VGETLEVWGVDSLQDMFDASSLQHSAQIGKKGRVIRSPLHPMSHCLRRALKQGVDGVSREDGSTRAFEGQEVQHYSSAGFRECC